MKNQDLGKLTYVQELISKAKESSSTRGTTSRRKGSSKTIP